MAPEKHVQRCGFHVLVWRASQYVPLSEFWQQFPETVLGKYLVNTSFDSGNLTVSEDEQRNGWRMVGRFAHSPRIQSVTQIPCDQYDEWLAFDEPVEVRRFETLINYLDYSPVDFDWDEKIEPFWSDILLLNPLHVFAENGRFSLITRDATLLGRLLRGNTGSFV